MLFSGFTKDFLQYQRDVAQNSAGEMDQKTLCLKNHLVPYFGAFEFASIEGRHIRQYVATKKLAGLAPATINHHLSILRRYFSFAEESKVVPEIPSFRQVKQRRKILKNYLTADQVGVLLQQADMHRNGMWRPTMKLAVNTGMRIGELLALDWKDVNFKEETVEVNASFCRKARAIKSTKSGDARVISLNEGALAALRQLHEMKGNPTEGLVLGVDYDTAQRAMTTISKRADLGKPVTWHTLRHTFATALVTRGEPLYVVSKLLGHSTVAMSERYAHLTRDRQYSAVHELDGIL